MIAVYFFAAILFILLAAVLIAPMLEGTPGPAVDAEARLAGTIEALRELEFEHETGKIETPDYEALRAELAREAIAARDAGARVDREAGTAGQPTCGVCGAAGAAAAKFCTRCGTPFGDAA